MDDSVLARGALVDLRERLTAGPSVFHYEPYGPLTHRYFERSGQPWIATYKSQWDGVGWLVTEANCRPLIIQPGDYILVRYKVDEHHGDGVMAFEDDGKGGNGRFISLKSIVFVEENPRVVPGDSHRERR